MMNNNMKMDKKGTQPLVSGDEKWNLFFLNKISFSYIYVVGWMLFQIPGIHECYSVGFFLIYKYLMHVSIFYHFNEGSLTVL